MKKEASNRLYKLVSSLSPLDLMLVVLFSILTLVLVVALIFSLQWQGYWDQVYFHHIAYLIFVKGLAPYRDIFDINMFGIYVFHGAIGGLFGYGDLALRLVDITWLVATSVFTFLIMRKFDWRAAWISSALFAWIYIAQGEMQILQREYLMILPMACSILLASTPAFLVQYPMARALLIGVLFGISATLKPNGAVGFPVVILFESQCNLSFKLKVFDKQRIASFIKTLLWGLLGFSLPLVLGILWLWSCGSLHSFYEMITVYWPMYAKVVPMATYRCMSDAERIHIHIDRIFSFYNLHNKQWLMLPALFAASLKLWRNFLDSKLKMLVVLLIFLFILNFFQTLAVGQFHPYSWMPMIYFLILLFSLCFSRSPQEPPDILYAILLIASLLAAACSCSNVANTFQRQLAGKSPDTPWTSRSREMADYLKGHMQAGDEVQVFDFLGGTSRALLDSGAMIATPICTDVYLGLMVKNPYVVRMRSDFADVLKTKRPRFIITVSHNRLYSFDPDDDGEFFAMLNDFITSNYKLAVQGYGYQIWEVLPPNAVLKSPAPP